MRILVVEDRAAAQTLEALFLRPGYEVEVFQNPSGALKSLAERRADLVLAEMEMPSMNGIEFATLVSDRQPGCQVLLFSSSLNAAPGVLGFDWAPYKVMHKPVDPRDLLCIAGLIAKVAA